MPSLASYRGWLGRTLGNATIGKALSRAWSPLTIGSAATAIAIVVFAVTIFFVTLFAVALFAVALFAVATRAADGTNFGATPSPSSAAASAAATSASASSTGTTSASAPSSPSVAGSSLTASAASPETQQTHPIAWGKRLFFIPYQANPLDAQRVAKVTLWMAREGAELKPLETARPEVTGFAYHAPEDGVYKFALQLADGGGRVWPSEPLQPLLRIQVDTQKPRVKLSVQHVGVDQVEAEYDVADETLEPSSLLLERQEAPGAWRPVERDVAEQQIQGGVKGRIRFSQPMTAGDARVRLSVRDRAGNQAVAEAAPPLVGPQFGTPPKELALRPWSPELTGERNDPPDAVAANAPDIPIGERPFPNADIGSGFGADVNANVNADQGERKAAADRRALEWPSQNASQPPNPGFSPPSRLISDALNSPSVNTTSDPSAARRSMFGEPPSSLRGDPGGDAGNRALFDAGGSGGGASPSSSLRAVSPFAGAARGTEFSLGDELPRESASRSPLASSVAATTALPSSAPASSALGQPNVRLVNSPTFDVEYDLEQVGSWGVAKVELWGTRDGGRTWTSYGADPDNRTPLRANVPAPGDYGFLIVVDAAGGVASLPPRPGSRPELWVHVDLHPPSIRLLEATKTPDQHGEHLQIRWEAQDDNLEQRPIGLYYSSYAAGPWSTIATGLENIGAYDWPLQRHLPNRFYVRVEARDTAGNLAHDQLRDPLTLDRPQPAGRLRDVRAVPR